jgi:hypothetical protein
VVEGANWLVGKPVKFVLWPSFASLTGDFQANWLRNLRPNP